MDGTHRNGSIGPGTRKQYVPRANARQTALPLTEKHWSKIAVALHLSGREVEIVRLICAGHKEVTIAHWLSISPHTVHSHVKGIHRKLGVNDRVGLVVRILSSAFEHRLAKPKRSDRWGR